MPTLLQHLEYMPFRELRAVVTRLNVRKQAMRDANDEWRRVIHAFWQNEECAVTLLTQLSPPAQTALAMLMPTECMTASLFFHEFGAIRRPGAAKRAESSPWRAPQSAAEELYYAGLLHAHTPVSIHRAQAVTLPEDLRHRLASLAACAPEGDGRQLLTLLHDCAQVLVFFQQNAHLRLLHGRWLTLDALAVLNQRLLRPAPEPLVSHKRTDWPAFLCFLCAAAGLVHQGQLTPAAWEWLGEPPARQLLRLWQGWQAASPGLRTLYGRPAAHLPSPWPALLVRLLGQQTGSFTAAALAGRLLATPAEFGSFFTAHFADIHELTNAIAQLLAADLNGLGVIEPSALGVEMSRSTAPHPRFSVTCLGNWLLHPADDAPFPRISQATALPQARLMEQPDGWRMEAAITPSGRALADLAPYLRDLEVDAATQRHILRLDRRSVAQASAGGHGLPALLIGLKEMGLFLNAEQVSRLQSWHVEGQSLQLLHLPVLRAATKEQMKQLRAASRLDRLFGELLSPTVSVLHAPPAEVARQLAQVGFDAATHPLFDEINRQEENAEAEGALWLAGKLYALFSQHAETPLPPPFAAMQRLWARLSEAQQATLQGQWQQIEAEFHRVVEGLVANPPPTPTDPNRWRPFIEQAIQEHSALDMHYFSATRNLLTRRLVEPYWVEERRWGPCLVGWCHVTGRVLTFRLDRIQGIEDGTVEDRQQTIGDGE
jgi:hypothetical protein